VETVLKTWGRIDILVNNAGGGIGPKGLIETRDDEWDAVVNLNLKSQFLCCREVAAPMRRQAWGRIVNIASNAGRYRSNTGFGGLAYSAAKGESSSSPAASCPSAGGGSSKPSPSSFERGCSRRRRWGGSRAPRRSRALPSSSPPRTPATSPVRPSSRMVAGARRERSPQRAPVTSSVARRARA